MNLDIRPTLRLSPPRITQTSLVVITYEVGAVKETRACDRIEIDGVPQVEQECYSVTGTLTIMQVERREVEVTPPAGTDFVTVKVFVREVNGSNSSIADELVCSAKLRVI